MLLIGKINDKAPNYWEASIPVVSILTYESIIVWIELQLNNDLITLLKIHFSCSDFAQNNIGVEQRNTKQ